MRRVTAVRAVAALVGVVALAGAVVGAVGPVQDVLAFRQAPLCAVGVETTASGADCIARETGSVTGRHSRVESVGDGSGGTVTSYELDFRRASGATQSREVAADLYRAAAPGERVQLRTWHGGVVRITVGDWSESYDPAREGVVGWLLMAAWTGLGLLLWTLLGHGALRHLLGHFGFRAFGWIHTGLWTMMLAHYRLGGDRSAGYWAETAALWLLVLVIGVGCIWWGWGEFDEEPSLLSLAGRRRRERTASRRRRPAEQPQS